MKATTHRSYSIHDLGIALTALVLLLTATTAFAQSAPPAADERLGVASNAIGVAKNATRDGREVTLDFYLENFDVETVAALSLTDDLGATFGSGNYAVLAAPSFVDNPGTITLNAGFNGSGDTQLISSGTLGAGDTAQIRVVVEVTTPSNVGFGLGIYFNQATASGQVLGSPVSDLSQSGTDPDPDNNGDPGDNSDSTRIDLTEAPAIGVAKTATLAGTQVTFDFYLENLGNRELSALVLADDLDAVFGAGNYAVSSPPAFFDNPGTITLNAGFNGSGQTALISSGSLAAGDTAGFRVVVNVTNVTDRGAGLGVYSNQVTASGASPAGTVASDLSDDGINPDPDGSGHGGDPGENDPTVFVIGEEPVLGVAKDATVVGSIVTFDFYLENLGDVALESLALADDLDAVFGADNYTVTAGPTLIDDPGTITLNAGFDGSSDTAPLTDGTLAVAETAQIQVTVRVFELADFGLGLGNYSNQVTATAMSAAGDATADLSDAGMDPDPSADGDPTGAGENDPTTFSVAEIPSIGLAKTVDVIPGPRVIITWYLENVGNVRLTSVTLIDDLDAVFGSGNYSTPTDPQVTLFGNGTVVGNNNYNGSLIIDVLNSGASLDPRALAVISVEANVTNVTDQGLGVGIYQNQAQASGQGPSGGMTSDLSDAGDVTDANDNGDAGDAGEDDPTDFIVGAFLGVAKTAMAAANQVTFDLYLENLGAVGLTGLSLEDFLDPVFGTGNYFVSAAPALIDDPGTLTLDPAFDGSTNDELLDPSSSLAAGDTAQIRFTVTATSLVNQGSGLGVYANQAIGAATLPNGDTVTDLSDSGTDPDPNGNGDPTGGGENDPTVFVVTSDAVVGAAKSANVAGSAVTFDLYLENVGAATANALSFLDDLDAVFGAGNYFISSAPALIVDPGTLILNGSYDGGADPELLAAGSTLASGALAQIRFTVEVTTPSDAQGLGTGVHTNQAIVTGSDSNGVVVSDLSHSGTDPDPGGDGDPTNEDEPTLFYFGDPAVGVALFSYVDGTQVTLDYYVENLGDTPLQNFFLDHPLNPVFGSGNYSIFQQPAVIEGPTTLLLSPQYFGFNIFSRVVLGGTLAAGETVHFRTVINVTNVTDQGDGVGVYMSQVTVEARSPDGAIMVTDNSDYGILADPNGNGNAADMGEEDPTWIILGEETKLGVAKDAQVSGNQVILTCRVENLGNVAVDNLTMEDDLDAVFGAGNYSVQTIGTGGSMNAPANMSFDGSGDPELFAAGGFLNAGETVDVQVTLTVSNIVDRGLGLGTYTNQVSVFGTGPTTTLAADVSDAGSDPDPNGNGIPADAGESDPTVFTLEILGVGAAKNAMVSGNMVTFDFYVQNLGDEPLENVAVSDDLDAVFGAGNYTLLSGPEIVGVERDIVPNLAFNGSSETLLLSGELLQNGVEQVRVVVLVDVLTDRGSGLGVYTNQVTITAETAGGTMVSDLSDAGTDPDPNDSGDGSEAGENDPTVFMVAEDVTAGVAKTASVSGGTVTFDYFLESFATVPVEVSLADDLDAVFGAGNYAVASGPSLVVNPGGLTVNAGFDGSASTALLMAGSTLGVGASAQVRVVVEVSTLADLGSGLGVYANQASLATTGPGGTMGADLSDSGTDPDPDGDGDPTEAGENDSTPFTVAENPAVGVAKTASVNGGEVTFDFYLESFANVAVDVSLADDLDAVFGAGNYTVTGAPALIADPGTLVVNAGYDGSADAQILSAGSTLAVGASAQVRVVVQVAELVDLGSGLGVYTNQASLEATAPGGTVALDASDSGTDPDPDGDGDPTEAGENDPTPFSVAEDPVTGVAKTASVNGTEVTFDFYLESFANVVVDVSLIDDLDAVFGAGNYAVTGAPSLIVDPGTLIVNASFDGSADPELLGAGSTLAVGASAQVRVVVEVTVVSDQGSGVGVYANQASLAATAPGGTMASDSSDSGTNPDPDGDGDPSEAGENDPTPVTLGDAEPPTVTGISTVAGPLSTCDTVRIPLTSLEVRIEDDLSSIENAEDPMSYLLVEAGPDGDFTTTACGVAAGDDIEIEIVSLSLQSADPLVVDVDLDLPEVDGLVPGLYRFFVCDTITDALGNALDGDEDGNPGGDFVLPFFRADPHNLFGNGHFDNCPVTLAPWQSMATAPNVIVAGTPGSDDYIGSPLSASARISHSSSDPSAFGQCVQVDGGFSGTAYRFEHWFRYVSPSDDVATLVRTCEFFSGSNCSLSSISTDSLALLVEDGGGEWVRLVTEPMAPPGAKSALCDVAIEGLGGDPQFDLFLDGFFFGVDGFIFGDGFESGDTSAWSATIP